ncbi:MAG: NADH-quinone oxidoreductase subunit H [Humidesulfovibrio sp.]|nr:NADH-quinone oxidoreductase subunit H [Humidesulfovibrio sp.]
MPAFLTIHWDALGRILAGLVLCPLLFGVINRVKAKFAGRQGQPLLQTYFDLARLLRKGAVYSSTTSWVFPLGPMLGLGCTLAALTLAPLGGQPGLFSFEGDLFLFAGLMSLGRFATAAAALDTGSSFEGMGASREMQFAVPAELAQILGFVALAQATGAYSLAEMLARLDLARWQIFGPVLALTATALFLVLLAETCRIPVDDPNTHLELTMIHEVMVLDHSGPDFAFILYGQGVKIWTLGAILTGVLIPARGDALSAAALGAAGIFGLALIIGIAESSMARLKLLLVPRLLVGATALSCLALILLLR